MTLPGPDPTAAPSAAPDPGQGITREADPVEVWRGAMADLRDAASRAPWRHPSVLPGWTVADVVAHVIGIERALLDRHDPAHEPDWSTLVHVTSDFGRITEVPVDLRRSWPREQVLEEFDVTIADRHTALRELQGADPGPVMSPLGTLMPLADMLAMRVFDTWVHEQDIRVGVGDPGHLDSAAAHMAARRMVGSLGFVWAKKVQAPIGATLAVTVTGPGVEFAQTVTRGEDGRGYAIGAVPEPTVALTMSFPDFVALSCGRGPADVTTAGDPALAERTIGRFNIAP